MLDIYAFYAVAAITVITSVSIFLQRKLIHAVVSLALAFFASALLFFLIGQTLIALLQLIVFVGGLSTYLIVAVATEEKSANLLRLPIFVVLAIIFFAGVMFVLQSLPSQQANSGSSFLNSAATALASSYSILYIIAVLLFAVTISGVLIIKKFARLLV